MDNSKIMVSIEELKSVLASLKKQKENLSSVYKGSISSVLESSNSCLAVANLDTSAIKSTFDSVFNDIDTNMDALINVLENKVIRNYSELAEAIRTMFNNDFMTKMNELIAGAGGVWIN